MTARYERLPLSWNWTTPIRPTTSGGVWRSSRWACAMKPSAHSSRGLALGPERATRLSRAGYVYGVTGQREKARAILARITNISRSKYVSAVDFAIVHLGL